MERKMFACCSKGERTTTEWEQNTTMCSVPQSKCSLAMAYVPWQKWESMYDDERALEIGTAFPSLNLPFCAGGVSQ